MNLGLSRRCSWAALVLAGAAAAGEPTPQDSPAEASAGKPASAAASTLANKLRLTRQQLQHSPAAQRIAQAPHAEAQARLAQARSLYEQAELEAEAGRYVEGLQKVDASLRLFMQAAVLVPDAAQVAVQEARRNNELRESLRTFALLHRNWSNRMAAINAPTPDLGADIARLDAMARQSDGLIASGQTHEAHVLLNSAHLLVVSTLNQMLLSETVVYDLKFATPADEYQHELAMNLGLEELVPLALEQVKVTREAAELAQRFVQQSRTLRSTAQTQQGSGDYAAALKSLQESSARLQQSLRVAGVAVPQSPQTSP